MSVCSKRGPRMALALCASAGDRITSKAKEESLCGQARGMNSNSLRILTARPDISPVRRLCARSAMAGLQDRRTSRGNAVGRLGQRDVPRRRSAGVLQGLGRLRRRRSLARLREVGLRRGRIPLDGLEAGELGGRQRLHLDAGSARCRRPPQRVDAGAGRTALDANAVQPTGAHAQGCSRPAEASRPPCDPPSASRLRTEAEWSRGAPRGPGVSLPSWSARQRAQRPIRRRWLLAITISTLITID